MKIGNVTLSGDAVLAPLAGFTDVGMRAIAKKCGAALTYTEMVSAKGLVYDSEKTKELLVTYPSEVPAAVQIFGGEEEYIGKAVANKCLAKFDIIDINMGCPVPKIVKNNEGSALLKDTDRAKRIVESAVRASSGRPVTVKMRIGFKSGENIAAAFAKALEESGASAIAVHGRTREQYYSGEADWDAIAEVVKSVGIPVFANGDVVDRASYERIKEVTGASGVMIGRGALGNPTIFSEIRGVENNADKKELLLEQISVLRGYYPDRYIYNTMKKHVGYYAKGMRDARKVKETVSSVTSVGELIAVVEDFF